MTYAAKGYFDALVKMGELASESQGSKELGKTSDAAETPRWGPGRHLWRGRAGVLSCVWSCFHWGSRCPHQTRSFSERTVTLIASKDCGVRAGHRWGALGSFRVYTGGSVPPRSRAWGEDPGRSTWLVDLRSRGAHLA